MSVLLSLRDGIRERIDASSITPHAFAALASAAIAQLPLYVGRRRLALADLFAIDGEKSDDVRVVGELGRVDGLGTGMQSGTLTIDGSAGRQVGALMRGGTIEVKGDAGDGAGLAMAGGLLRITGSAGDRLGAPVPGASRGMTGGEIIVRGNAGADAAKRVRRGLVVVGGNTGASAAHAMIAGTIVVGGRLGAGAGLWSKRGSVIALGAIEIPPTYRYACTYRPPFMPVLMRYLERVRQFAFDARFAVGRYKRWTGDVADVGKGEILEWTT
jgi:formylmethanofuran dehydrogenase subunit C